MKNSGLIRARAEDGRWCILHRRTCISAATRALFALVIPYSVGAQHVSQLPSLTRLAGAWVGIAGTPPFSLPLVLSISTTSGGSLIASLTNAAEGANRDSRVRFVRDSVFGSLGLPAYFQFSGKLTSAADTLRLSSTAGAFTMVRAVRTQQIRRPVPYREMELSFATADGSRVPGTLLLPNVVTRFPIVVMTAGVGSHDRDGSTMHHYPFRVIADYLARRGIATFRYDSRGPAIFDSAGAKSRPFGYADDLVCALEKLSSIEDLAGHSFGLLGHGEGAVISSVVSARRSDVKFLVLLSGVGVSRDSLELLQSLQIAKANGLDTASAEELNAFLDARRAFVSRSDSSSEVARRAFEEAIGKLGGEISDVDRAAIQRTLNSAHMFTRSRAFREFGMVNPQIYLSQLRIPVLALSGAKDTQVPPRENLSAIRAALIAGGNSDFQTTLLPNLNHILQFAHSGEMNESLLFEETISPEVLEILQGWILLRTGPQRR